MLDGERFIQCTYIVIFSYQGVGSTVILGRRAEGESKRGPKAHLARKRRRQGQAKTCSYLGYYAAKFRDILVYGLFVMERAHLKCVSFGEKGQNEKVCTESRVLRVFNK